MFKTNLIKFFSLIFLLILNLVLFFSLYSLKNQNEFEIDFLDVGQGNGTLIKTDDGLKILVDSGIGELAKKSLYKNLSFFDRKIDLFFATHYDIDHVGNFPDYLNKYQNSYFFSNGKNKKTPPIYDEIFKALKSDSSKNIILKSGDLIRFNKNFYLKIFAPDKNINPNLLRDNSSSLVLQFIYKNKKFLITGDLPIKFEKWLVEKYGSELKSNILLAGHHGSKTSSSEEFLKIVNPDLIIFSAGKNNKFHHPNKEVLDRVKKLGIKYLRTDEVGTIKYFFKNNSWKLIYKN